jgi:diguanylate cyclase (GGDEF)-like protein
LRNASQNAPAAVARFDTGGEEFCIVFSDKNSKECHSHLESVRGLIADQPFSIRKGSRPLKKPKKPAKKPLKTNRVNVTVSIGVAERSAQHNQPDSVMKQSDLALYRAKNEGRNRVCS